MTDYFKASLDAKCLVGGALNYSPEQNMIRLPGTFVSPWHWAWFLIGNSATTFAVSFFDSSRFWRVLGLAGMALVFINAVICGQRAALAVVPMMFLMLLLLTGQIVNLRRFLPIGLLLALVLGTWIVMNPSVVQERVDSLVGRWNSSPPHLFIKQQIDWAIEQEQIQGFLGGGVGKATNSTRVFGEIVLVETYHAKLLFELGYMGLIAMMIFLAHVAFVSFKNYRSIRDPVLRGFASSLWGLIVFISFCPYWYPLDTDPIAVYYWFFVGVIAKLPVIDKREQEAIKIAIENETNPKIRKQLRAKLRPTI